MPDVVVVGAAARDIAPDDERGWRLGGGVSYSSLTVARLGLRTGALIGLDGEAGDARELDLLREAGVDVRVVPLANGPVFSNIEQRGGRLQLCHGRSDPIPVTALPPEWASARGWILAPVAAEIPEAWADVPAEDAIVALGWQGLLRELVPGEPVRHSAPRPHPVLGRADLVGVSRDDVDPAIALADLYGLLHPGAMLAITRGDHGGLVVEGVEDDQLQLRHYPAVKSPSIVDPTGAGDVFLAALAATRIQPRLVGGRIGQGMDLLIAASAASLVLEAPGLTGIPTRDQVRQRAVGARRPIGRGGGLPGSRTGRRPDDEPDR
jgi:sugar/nucleoside kinase (ribokinase family)